MRASELRPGGRLVVVLPGIAEDGSVGLEPLFNHANAVLEEMVAANLITATERSGMTLMNHLRPERDLLSPFRRDGEFNGLVMEDCQRRVLLDSAWQEYERSGDEQALAASRVFFFRTAFLPSFSCALNQGTKNGETVHRFAEQLERRLTYRLAVEPVPMHTLVQIIVFAKQI